MNCIEKHLRIHAFAFRTGQQKSKNKINIYLVLMLNMLRRIQQTVTLLSLAHNVQYCNKQNMHIIHTR